MKESEGTEEITTFPLSQYLLQGQQALPLCQLFIQNFRWWHRENPPPKKPHNWEKMSFGHMHTSNDQISLCNLAVFAGPWLSTYRITEYYIIYWYTINIWPGSTLFALACLSKKLRVNTACLKSTERIDNRASINYTTHLQSNYFFIVLYLPEVSTSDLSLNLNKSFLLPVDVSSIVGWVENSVNPA